MLFSLQPEDIKDVQSWKVALEEVIKTNCSYFPRTKSV